MPQPQRKPEEKAEAPRYLPLQTVSVRMLSESLAPQRRVFGIVANISETGACVIVNEPMDVDLSVTLDVELAERGTRMAARARVVWCAERLEPVKEIVGYLTGVAFVDPPDQIEKLLKSGIFQLVP